MTHQTAGGGSDTRRREFTLEAAVWKRGGVGPHAR